MTDFDCCVIGAGIIGLANANLLAAAGFRVVVIERHPVIGFETTSRNSGVVHASLYYPPGSLKATSCTEGRELLYRRCARTGVAHRRTGKLVVATGEDELEPLARLQTRARDNGAGAVELLDEDQVRRLEPRIRCAGALFSPESGIVDVHGLAYVHKKEATESGAVFSFDTTALGLDARGFGWEVRCRGRDASYFTVTTRFLVLAPGLEGENVAAMLGLDVNVLGLRHHYCKGDYFSLASRYAGAIQRLVYPLPVQAGLGVHLTLDLAGNVTAGPDATYVGTFDYHVSENKRAAFASAVRRYLPELRDDDLTPAYAGIRPKLQGPTDQFRDFFVEDLTALGAPRAIGLFGIESPGITASEALAHRVVSLVRAS